MKKVLGLVLSVMLILSLSACSGKKEAAAPAQDSTQATTQAPTQAATTAAETPKFKDGVYKADGEKRQFGYETVEVTVEGGKITKVDLKRMNPDGTEVNYDEWTGKDGKPNLKQFREDLAKQIIEKQATDGIDAVSGATDSTKTWIQAVGKALESAK